MDKPIYRFFAIDYFATGEGRSIWLQICRYRLDEERDYEYEKFANFVNYDYYLHGFDELTEEEYQLIEQWYDDQESLSTEEAFGG